MKQSEDPWAPIEVPDGGEAVRTFGPLDLRIRRDEGQWIIERHREGRARPARPLPIASEQRQRFVAEDESATELLPSPTLADRAIVVRPETPMTVVGGSSAGLVVSTPLSVLLSTGSGRRLAEIPTVLLKESWFGPDTRTGQLCYAARTSAALAADNAERSPFRAYTSLTIENRTEEPFEVARVRVPTPYLALCRDGDGNLVTPALRIVRTSKGDGTEAAAIAPTRSREVEVVVPSRLKVDAGVLRSLGRMLG